VPLIAAGPAFAARIAEGLRWAIAVALAVVAAPKGAIQQAAAAAEAVGRGDTGASSEELIAGVGDAAGAAGACGAVLIRAADATRQTGEGLATCRTRVSDAVLVGGTTVDADGWSVATRVEGTAPREAQGGLADRHAILVAAARDAGAVLTELRRRWAIRVDQARECRGARPAVPVAEIARARFGRALREGRDAVVAIWLTPLATETIGISRAHTLTAAAADRAAGIAPSSAFFIAVAAAADAGVRVADRYRIVRIL